MPYDEHLTDEERQLLEELEAEGQDTETQDATTGENRGDNGGSPSPAGEDEDGGSDAEGEEGAPILAQDGKATIPYSELATARELAKEYKRRIDELEAKTAPKAEAPPKAPDRYERFRALSPVELRELEDAADEAEAAEIVGFKQEQLLEQLEQRQHQKAGERAMADFMAEHKALLDKDPLLLPMMDGVFGSFVAKGQGIEQALESTRAELVGRGILPSPDADDQAAKDTVKAKVDGLRKPAAPSTLARAGRSAAGASFSPALNDDSLEDPLAEQAFLALPQEVRDRWLRTGKQQF